MIAGLRRVRVVIQAFYELARYDVLLAVFRVQNIHRQLAIPYPDVLERDLRREAAIVAIFDLTTSLYWKRVRCLQRSVCLVRLLRKHGVPARLVIGYRPAPLVSHAWTEVHSQVVADSSAYPDRLRILMSV